MQNSIRKIDTISQENNKLTNFDDKEYQPANTSLQSIPKKFFIIKNETRSHRTSYSTSDSIYIGNYINKKRNGPGKLILADQSYYEGNFKDGEFDGNGYYRTRNYTYKGQFIQGKKNGKGKLENFTTKSIYEGEFKNDMKEGYGIEKFSDGSVYKGFYSQDMKQGKGILTLKKEKNNSIFEGEFKNNKIDGEGIFKWDNGKEYEGSWVNNEISGFGILTESNIKHIGYFSHDKKEGYGASFFTNKNFVMIGKWVNDVIEGVAIIYSLDVINNNINIDTNIINEEKIIIMKGGNIINSNLNEEELNNICLDNDYINAKKLFKEKFLNEYSKNMNIIPE